MTKTYQGYILATVPINRSSVLIFQDLSFKKYRIDGQERVLSQLRTYANNGNLRFIKAKIWNSNSFMPILEVVDFIGEPNV